MKLKEILSAPSSTFNLLCNMGDAIYYQSQVRLGTMNPPEGTSKEVFTTLSLYQAALLMEKLPCLPIDFSESPSPEIPDQNTPS